MSTLPTMSISLGSCLIVIILISMGRVPCLTATFPLQGCQTEDIDLLLVADDIFSPDDGQMFFTELLDHFLSPDEVLLTRLRVAMVVAGRSDGPGLLFSFQSYNTTDEVKKHLKADPIVNNPRSYIDETFDYICYSHDVKEGFRENSTHVAVVVVGNIWRHEMLRDLYHSYRSSCRFEMFLILLGHYMKESVLLQIAKTEDQLYLPTLEIDNALPVKLCNRCNVKSWSIPHQSLQYKQSCYFLHVHEAPMTWFEASNECKIQGGQLVSIEAEEELQFLESKLNNYNEEVYLEQIADLGPSEGREYFGKMYIGLVRDTTRIGSPFLWMNNNPLIYTHWVNTLPDGGPNQRCGLWLFRRRTEWSESLRQVIYNASNLKLNYNGWEDMGCGSRFTSLALCETIITRNQVEHQIENMKTSPANMDSFTSAVTRGEFLIFQDKIVSNPAFVRDSTYVSFLKKTGSLFRVFRCNGEDDNTNIIPYSYVCDHIEQCDFGQDENRCWHRPCDLDAEFTCSSGQCVPLESRCDVYTDCYDGSDEEDCQFCNSAMCCDGSCLPRHFIFNGEIDCVGCDSASSYFYDRIEHDESFHTDEGLRDYDCPFVCNRSECVTPSMLNDGITHCLGPEGPLDEIWGKLETVNLCKISLGSFSSIEFVRWSPRCVYIKDRYGTVIGCRDMSHLHDCQNFTCPEGYVKCPDSYCIPLHLVGDGLKDCPMGEDELLGMNVNCTGNFACWGGEVCVHPDFVCDGHPHCPSGDDELNCHVSCGEGFRCIGGTVTVTDYERSNSLQDLTFIDKRTRYLNLSGVNLSKTVSAGNKDALKNVVEMYLSNCQIGNLDGNMVSDFRLTGVYTLDLSHNLISTLSDYNMLSFMYNLRVLDLSHNKRLASMAEYAFNVIIEDSKVSSYLSKSFIETLNLAFTAVTILEKALFYNLPNLKYLNLSHTYITIIDQQSFPQEFHLDSLDLRYTPLSNIEPNALTSLSVSKDLYSDMYKLCCPQVRGQGIPEHVCHAPASAISSCMDLIQEPAQRVLLWTVGVLAVTGNLVVITYRLLWDRAVLKKSYGLFVTNLSVSDLFMGVYLLIIAGTDVIYRDNYVWYESDWRHSTLCQTAGFLSTLSSETSAFFILLVTVDRFLVIRFPFGQFRFTRWSIILSCVIAWGVGFVLALVPALPRFQHWQMYSSNGMCLGLPLTPDRRSGWEYSAALFIGLNFILFLFIAFGQYLIYRAMSENSMKMSSAVQGNTKRVQEIMVAKQLSIVVLSDFLCWFPIGIMGLLAMSGRDIGTEVYAWSAVLVLPINSALNPVLYTVPLIMKKWENFKYGNNKAKTNSSFKSRESTRETVVQEMGNV